MCPVLNIEFLSTPKIVVKSRKGDFQMSYLVCDKRKGSPKIHVEVCRRKCKLIQECKTYKEFVDSSEKKAA
jgi:hypothetical protein